MYLVVGAGLTGCIFAQKIATELKEKVVLIDKRDHLAGYLYDYKDKNDILIHKFGPHIFHTDERKTWDYLSQFTKWYPFNLKLKAFVEGNIVPMPFNLNTLYDSLSQQMAQALEVKLINNFGYNKRVRISELKQTNDKDLNFLADYIFESVYKGYINQKHLYASEEKKEKLIAKVSISLDRNDQFYHDKYQAVPSNGYSEMMKNIIDNKLIELKLNVDFRNLKPSDLEKYTKIIYTGNVDEFFDYKYGKLPYENYEYDIQSYESKNFQDTFQITYPNEYDYIFSTEYKHLYNKTSNNTTVVYTHPSTDDKEHYYPITSRENKDIYTQYFEETKQMDNYLFVGRLAEFRYFSMTQTIENSLMSFENNFINK